MLNVPTVVAGEVAILITYGTDFAVVHVIAMYFFATMVTSHITVVALRAYVTIGCSVSVLYRDNRLTARALICLVCGFFVIHGILLLLFRSLVSALQSSLEGQTKPRFRRESVRG
jgi:hypothetical protein